MNEVLRITGLRVQYEPRTGLLDRLSRRAVNPARAVDGVDLRLHEGETLALVGESGSGKSTLARALLGVAPITTGQVWFDGRPVLGPGCGSPPPSFRRQVQMIYQDPYESLDPRRRVLSIVRAPLDIHRRDLPRPQREARALEALERVGLSPAGTYGRRHAHELSGGERQRVSVAAALILEPRIIIADEPVSMLDVSIRGRVLDLLQSLKGQMALALVLITHDLGVAARTADSIAVMYLGRIVEHGPTGRVIQRPAHPYTRALLSVSGHVGDVQGRERTVLEGEVPDPSVVPSGCRFHPRCPRSEPRCTDRDPALLPVVGDRSHAAACLLVEADRRTSHATPAGTTKRGTP